LWDVHFTCRMSIFSRWMSIFSRWTSIFYRWTSIRLCRSSIHLGVILMGRLSILARHPFLLVGTYILPVRRPSIHVGPILTGPSIHPGGIHPTLVIYPLSVVGTSILPAGHPSFIVGYPSSLMGRPFSLVDVHIILWTSIFWCDVHSHLWNVHLSL
jgi:hypothetical protein